VVSIRVRSAKSYKWLANWQANLTKRQLQLRRSVKFQLWRNVKFSYDEVSKST
jgi:hypothetical protein